MATEVNESNVSADIEPQEAPQTVMEDEIKLKQESSSQGNDANEADHDDNNNGGQNQDDGEDDERMDNDDADRLDDSTGNNNESLDDSEKTNLIVNYLPQQMTDEQFEELFKKYGPMKSCKIVRNKNTGYSYGFGFADYETHEQALKAIDELNGHEVDTKKIKVAFARPAGQDIKQANLYVKGIPNSWTQDDVKKVFDPYGQIIQVRVLGNDRGIAFVLFDLRKQAQEAMEALNGTTPDGCEGPFEIKFAADKKSEKRGNRGGQNQSGRRERGGRRRGGRSLSNNRNNNDANNSNQRRGTSQQGRGQGGRGMFNKPMNNNSNNSNGNSSYNNNNNNNNNHMNNGGVGPVRQQQGNRMSRYAPFAPMQQPPMQPTAAPGIMPSPYGYAAQPMMQYMLPNQMMQMSQMGHQHQQQQQQHMQAMAGHAMNPYAQMGYAQPPSMAQPATAISNMYNLASSTMNNAAQMQPQLGQPMNMRGAPNMLGSASGGSTVGGGGGGGSGGSGGSDGVTLFVYNIGQTADDNELKGMFSSYGDVIRSNVVRKTPGGETKGFGFVTLRSRDQANAAIAALNGQMRNGKTLQVSFKK